MEEEKLKNDFEYIFNDNINSEDLKINEEIKKMDVLHDKLLDLVKQNGINIMKIEKDENGK